MPFNFNASNLANQFRQGQNAQYANAQTQMANQIQRSAPVVQQQPQINPQIIQYLNTLSSGYDKYAAGYNSAKTPAAAMVNMRNGYPSSGPTFDSYIASKTQQSSGGGK